MNPLNLALQFVSSESKLWLLYVPLILVEFNVKLPLILTDLEGVYVMLNSEPILLLVDKFIG